MNKQLKITLKVDANTGAVSATRGAFAELDETIERTHKKLGMFSSTTAKVMGVVALAVGTLYTLKEAFHLVSAGMQRGSEFEQYSNRMHAFTTSLSATKNEMARASSFALKYNQDIAKTTETLLLMKNYGLKDTNEQLKIFANTALGSGKSIDQFAEAMADALTGENERLKEFGINASLQGQKIAYAWSDSSGQARNIVIDNNKDIIDSTLSAIFNEKYLGQLDRYSHSWDGVMQGMKNQWQSFTLSIGKDGGLFDYIKILASNISTLLGAAFDKGKGAAKDFGGAIISFANDAIIGVGNIVDAYNGLGLTIESIKLAWYVTAQAINEATLWWTNAFNAAIAGIHNLFKQVVDGIGRGWVTTINTMGAAWSKFVGSIKGVGNFLLDKAGIDFRFTQSNFQASSYVSSMQKVSATTQKTTESIAYFKNKVQDSTKAVSSLYQSVKNEDGKTKALSVVANIQAQMAKVNTEEKQSNIEKQKAKDLLEEIGAGYGQVAKKATKVKRATKAIGAGSGKSGVVKQAEKDAKGVQKVAEQEAKAMQGVFSSGLKQIFSGDILGGLESMLTGISDQLMKPMIDKISESLSSMLSSVTSGLGAMGGLLGGIGINLGIGLVKSLFGKSEKAPEKIDDLHAQSDSIAKSLDRLYNVQYPMLSLTREMKGSLQTIASSFGKIENNMLRSSVDFSGASTKDTVDSGTLWWGADTHELNSASLDFSSLNLQELINKQLSTKYTENIKNTDDGILWDTVTYTDNTTDVSSVFASNLATAGKEVYTSINSLGHALKMDVSDLGSQIIDIGKFSTKGMKPEEISKEVQSRFGAEMDAISSDYFAGLKQFQLGGEGMFETASRVAGNMEQVTHSLALLGMTLTPTKTKLYELTESMIAGAGDIDKLNTGIANYQKDFFSKQEQYTMQLKNMQSTFDTLGVVMPTTNKGFRDLVEGLDTSSTTGAKLYGELMSVAGEFSDLTDTQKELNKQTGLSTTQIQDMLQSMDRMGELTVPIKNKITNLSQAMVEAAGSADTLLSGMSAYQKGFFTQQEQYGMQLSDLQSTFARLGVSMPKTGQGFRDLVEGIDKSTQSGATLFGELMATAGDFSALVDARAGLEDVEKKQKSVITQQKELAKEQSKTITEQISQLRKYAGELDAHMLSKYSGLSIEEKLQYSRQLTSNTNTSAADSLESAKRAMEIAYKYARTDMDYKVAAQNYEKLLRQKSGSKKTIEDLIKKQQETDKLLVSLDQKLESLNKASQESNQIANKQDLTMLANGEKIQTLSKGINALQTIQRTR